MDEKKFALLLLEKQLKAEGIELRSKKDFRYRHFYVPLFMWVVGLFKPELKKSFYEDFWTTIGNSAYYPVYIKNKSVALKHRTTILHERQHVFDCREHPILFRVSYVLSKRWRAYWERRGYTHNLLSEYNRRGSISEGTKKWLVDLFKGPMYFYMDPDPEPKIKYMCDSIESGTQVLNEKGLVRKNWYRKPRPTDKQIELLTFLVGVLICVGIIFMLKVCHG